MQSREAFIATLAEAAVAFVEHQRPASVAWRDDNLGHSVASELARPHATSDFADSYGAKAGAPLMLEPRLTCPCR
jgi:hypothetical protein